jgi:hypothetical protein
MLFVHSALNGAGFAALGLTGWTLAGLPTLSPPPGIPFSRLRSQGQVGPTFFERTNALDTRPAPRGLVGDLRQFDTARFSSSAVHPTIRAFYEDTGAFTLTVKPEWPRRSAPARWVWAGLGRRFGQMDFPREGDGSGTLESRLLAVRADLDGRSDVRGWVRVHPDGRALYVAAYSTHAWGGEPYANIAFPLPGGNLTSVLRWEALEGGGVLLTTHPGARPGDQGVYFANRWLPIRLPINETIRVWVDAEGPQARHDIRVLGMAFLTLRYRMRAGGAGPDL